MENNIKKLGKKIRITKCYLIEIVDENDKELVSDFFFGKLADAQKEGEIMKNKCNFKEVENKNADSN